MYAHCPHRGKHVSLHKEFLWIYFRRACPYQIGCFLENFQISLDTLFLFSFYIKDFYEKICKENLWIEDDDQRQRNRSEIIKMNKYSTNQGEDRDEKEKDENILNQPRRRWESSSFVSFLGCSDARSRRLERLCFLKINIYKLKIIINQSGQDDQRDYVSCNVVISVMNRTLQVFNEWKQIIWVFSIPGILFPNASIVFKSPWWLTVFSFEIQDNML